MNHTEINQPRLRNQREPVICMNCGQLKPANEFYRKTDATDTKQSWCKTCTKEYHKRLREDVVAARFAEADIKERREVLISRHEAGREHLAEHCPMCAVKAVLP